MNNIGILADFSKTSGLGHFKRMIGLSKELKRLNSKCFFFINSSNFIKLKKKISDNIEYIIIKDCNFKSILNQINLNNLNTIIFDTYNKKFLNYEKKLLEHKIKVVAIDDFFYKHYANLVFTNNEKVPSFNYSPNQIWFNGFEYALTSSVEKSIIRQNLGKKLKILFHAGGGEDFESFDKFFKYTLNYLNNRKNLKICVLSKSKKTQNFFKRLNYKKINYIRFKNNISNLLQKFDIVCGPLGTTTFETILAGSFPFTFSRKKIAKDSFMSWSKNGHLINLNKNEIKKKIVIEKTWKFTLNNLKMLKSILKNKSKKLDGEGNERVARCIVSKKIPKRTFKINKKEKFTQIEKCSLEDIREYFIIRNQKNNKRVSISKQNIIWPDHLNWYLNNKIKKFKLTYLKKTQLFFWYKSIQDSNGKFILSGIMINEKSLNKLNFIGQALKKLKFLIKKKFSNATWVVVNKKDNLIFERFNLSMGFKKIQSHNLQRLKNLLKVNTKYFNIKELKIS